MELAMNNAEDPVKVKKHKKHKKSKKSAITLDEFLSMNQDVFGEGLDFQGVEELPTRVVKKRLKNNKKQQDSMNSVTSVELEKLKKAGIVIKKKIGRNPIMKGLKVKNSMPSKGAQYKTLNKMNPETELKTSSEVLTKLINQSNNQIKIVKKSNTDNSTNETKLTTKEDPVQEREYHDKDLKGSEQPIDKSSTATTSQGDDTTKNLISLTSKQSSAPSPERFSKIYDDNFNSDTAKQVTEETSSNDVQKISKDSDTPKSDNNKNDEVPTYTNCKEINKNESEVYNSDTEERANISDSESNNHKLIVESRASCNDTNNSMVSSLSTLKRLSHLITVKPVTPNKNPVPAEHANNKITEAREDKNSPKGNTKETTHLLSSSDKASPNKTKNIVDKDPTFDALKNLSKNITIKSLSTKRTIDENESEDDSEINETGKTNNVKLLDNNKNLTIKKVKVETSEPTLDKNSMNSLSSQEKKPQIGKPLINKSAVGMKPSKMIVENAENSAQTSNANLLKRLPNITTKPIINNRPPAVKPTNTVKQITKAEEKKEEIIEIFDIDDSEDEIDNNTKQPVPAQNPIKSMNALKNLSKNITVKSSNQQLLQKNINLENNVKLEKQCDDNNSNYKDDSNVDAQINIHNKNMAFKNALQGLCKNITIKSWNASSSQSIKSEACERQDFKVMEDNDASDSDSYSENIKISEIGENISGNEDNSEEFEELYKPNNNPIVESPNDSHSDNDENDEKAHDFEAEIKANTVQKCYQNKNPTINSKSLNNLMNISNNITIKSLSKSATDKEDTIKLAQGHESSESVSHNLKKQLPLKLAKQIIQEQSENTSTGRNSSKFGQIVDHTSTQCLNQRITGMNQVNTTNTEVTVKTIQTKTVIQEITTTVTKTIKTVNQTMKQEVRNTCHANTPMLSQKVQGMRPSQSKNLQGVIIRHAAPNFGAKTSNTIPQIRPANTVVRPPKQLAPVRSGVNLPRPNNPRMAVGKKVTPSPSPNKHVIGKPLKISPTAMVSSIIKRPNTEDVCGPFSCFKKPKESLIPVLDIPTFANSGGETTAQFSAASHTSSSNFTSTTKMIKGNNCTTTAKQMKSEVNTSAQQVSRLSNTIGLKIRSNPAKQTQVQEKSEVSEKVMKQNTSTLEAIQRLQKQGLLVKKPRVDTNDGNGDSDHDDDKVGYSSADEPDE